MNLKETEDDFQKRTGQRAGNKGIPKGKNLPEIVNAIVFVRQLEAKVLRTRCIYSKLQPLLLTLISIPFLFRRLFEMLLERS